jgi:hypothetical protein
MPGRARDLPGLRVNRVQTKREGRITWTRLIKRTRGEVFHEAVTHCYGGDGHAAGE